MCGIWSRLAYVEVELVSISNHRYMGRYIVKTIIRVLISILILIVGYEWMVAAFDKLNQPSDHAFYTGIAMLVVLGVLLPTSLWRLWRK